MSQNRLNAGSGKSGISPLFEDLNFIKSRRRYPINKHTAYLVFSGIGIIVFSLLMLSLLIILGWGSSSAYWMVPILFTFILLNRAYALSSLLRFRQISTNKDTRGNTELLRRFLQEQQLAFYQSPLAPEVIQIASRPLSPDGGQREILVFIADEKRILLNSHFTSGFTEGIPLKLSGEYRKMERLLRHWLQDHEKYPEHFVHKLKV